MDYPKNANFFMFILMIFLVFIGNFISLIMLKIFPGVLSAENIWIFQSGFAIFCFISPIILYMLVKRLRFKDILPLKPLSIKNIFIIIFMAFAMQPLLQLIGAITNIFYKDEVSDSIYMFASLSLPKALFVVAIIPSITEELAFRGVILTGYKKTSILVSVLMSSIYFGMMHFTITQLFYAIVAGIIFATVVKVTQSIYAGILMHFIFNGTQITMAHFVTKYAPNIQNEISSISYSVKDLIYPILQFIFSLPFLLLSIFLFIIFNKENIEILRQENNQLKNIDKPKVFTVFFYVNIIFYIAFIGFKNIM